MKNVKIARDGEPERETQPDAASDNSISDSVTPSRTTLFGWAHRKDQARSYAELDGPGNSTGGGQAKSKRKLRADKRNQTEPCRRCGVEIKVRGPQPVARNLDGTRHRCLSEARKAKKCIRPVSKKRLKEMKARYRELMLMRKK